MDNLPSWLKIKRCRKVFTKDVNGRENGFLVDILNRHDEIFADRTDEVFQQFYYSTVYKHMFKGFHTHPHKLDTVFCLFGKAQLVIHPEVIEKGDDTKKIDPDKLIIIPFDADKEVLTITFPSKYPHGYFGVSDIAYILNYRNPAWNPDDKYQYDIKLPLIEEYLINRIKTDETD